MQKVLHRIGLRGQRNQPVCIQGFLTYKAFHMGSSLGWLILVREHGSDEPWHDCREGPFDSFEEAHTFADAEVGADYVLVEMFTLPTNGGSGERMPFSRSSHLAIDLFLKCRCDEKKDTSGRDQLQH